MRADEHNQAASPPSSRRWRVGLGIALPIVVLGVAWLIWGLPIGRPKPTKVILISIDTLRADHLGYAGYVRSTSPAIDRFASRSVRFLNAFSHSPSTLPSHATMFTSLYPRIHGAEISVPKPLGDEFITVTEVFRDHGYRTGAFVAGGQLDPVWNLNQGFETYEVDKTCINQGWDNLKGILESASKWIEAHRSEPLFCFIHSYVVHGPYLPRPPYDRMFDEGYEGPLPFGIMDELEGFNSVPHLPTEPDVKHVVSLYDGEIRYMDQLLGEFLEKLEEWDMADETVVVFTSDHGEEFAEHGKVGVHAHTLYDELLRVPLVIHVPGGQPRAVARQVRLIDLAPTILGLMGIDPAPLEGVGENLLADPSGRGADLPLLAERPTGAGPEVSLRLPGRKLIWGQGTDARRFDLLADSVERLNLYRADSTVDSALMKQLESMIYENRTTARNITRPMQLSPEIERELRSLGYLK